MLTPAPRRRIRPRTDSVRLVVALPPEVMAALRTEAGRTSRRIGETARALIEEGLRHANR